MSDHANHITVKLLGRDFQVKCPADKIGELQESASYLNTKMEEVANTGTIMSMDRIAAIAALNIAHELQQSEKQKNNYIDTINQRIYAIQHKIEEGMEEFR
ncbi:MAG: cell division protein ZapA [Coxiellaceae bacterium]|nr:cell division protein ZapA [Coxiellaceae bacterium]